MEGKKAYILPGVAVLVLLVLVLLRGQASDTAAPPAEPAPAPAPTASKGVKAQIRDALADAGEPTLPQSAQQALQAALAPVVARCREGRASAATETVRVAVEVIAAQGIGVRVERAEVQGSPPADLVGCVREGLLGTKPEDLGHTGRLSATLEFAAS